MIKLVFAILRYSPSAGEEQTKLNEWRRSCRAGSFVSVVAVEQIYRGVWAIWERKKIKKLLNLLYAVRIFWRKVTI